jgi:hypothetical protein
MGYEIINGKCEIEMPKLIERGVTVDACIADPPYGTTACAWDAVIPFAPMWASLKQLVKRSGAIVLFGSQPFTSALVMSNPKMFRCEWTWAKSNGGGFLNANRYPLKRHENIVAFSREASLYNPQMDTGEPYACRRAAAGETTQDQSVAGWVTVSDGSRYPTTVLDFSNETGLHPTQKPVELMRYLVRTYTNPGDTVLDFTAGSFTTGVACIIEGRNFIGIEQDEHYCAIGEARMKRASGIPADIPRLNRRQIETPLFMENLS